MDAYARLDSYPGERGDETSARARCVEFFHSNDVLVYHLAVPVERCVVP